MPENVKAGRKFQPFFQVISHFLVVTILSGYQLFFRPLSFFQANADLIHFPSRLAILERIVEPFPPVLFPCPEIRSAAVPAPSAS